MDNHARESYLQTQLLTATPQKLRLLLICGAIRFAQETLRHWEEDSSEEAFESLTRCRGIVVELMTTVRRDDSEVAAQVFSIYLFVFQALTDAQATRNAKELQKIILVLEEERHTWQEVCETMPEAPDPALLIGLAPREVTAADAEAQLAAFDSNQQGGLLKGRSPVAPSTPFQQSAGVGGGFSIDG